MLDCLLINPRSIYHTSPNPAAAYLYAGLLSIGSLLDDRGCRTRILDMVVESDPEKAIRDAVGEGPLRPPLFGLSVMTAQVPHAVELSRFIRRTWPGAVIVWGGIHPSLYPEEVLEAAVADYACLGEGEETALELWKALQEGGDGRDVKGLCFRGETGFISTGARPKGQLDEMPFLNYRLLNYDAYRDRKVYRGNETLQVRFGVIVTGFGCPYRCSFCINSNRKLFLAKYRRKSPKRIVDEIEFLMAEHGVDYFDFIDENFFVLRRHVEEFADEVERRGLSFRWFTNMRADAASRGIVDGDLLRRLQKIGLYRLAVGAESGSQRMLDKLRKDIQVEQIPETAEMVSASGMGATFSFMMGVPGEKRADLLATLDLIGRLGRVSKRISIIGPQIFRPYPGGVLFEECVEKYGYRPPRNLEEWGNSVDLLSGFEGVDRFRWIEDPELLKRISFFIEFVHLNIGSLRTGLVKRTALRAMKALATLRLRLQFWAMPVEMYAVLFVKRIRRR